MQNNLDIQTISFVLTNVTSYNSFDWRIKTFYDVNYIQIITHTHTLVLPLDHHWLLFYKRDKSSRMVCEWILSIEICLAYHQHPHTQLIYWAPNKMINFCFIVFLLLSGKKILISTNWTQICTIYHSRVDAFWYDIGSSSLIVLHMY